MKHADTNSIDATESDYLYKGISQISDSGEGLFTAIDIFRDEIIARFTGEILTDWQAAKRQSEGKDRYFINMLDGSILDSMHADCFARFANDANGLTLSNFKNNSRIVLDENGNVCIQATRKIKANEELFCSYGRKYWNQFEKHGKNDRQKDQDSYVVRSKVVKV
ncbi:MAG: SET domain-containing protein-lysine N-methyltransferase [Bacteroidia bacterium]